MLSSAKDDPKRLSDIFHSAKKHIHSSQQLFRLADNAFRIAVPSDGSPKSDNLLSTAFNIGLHVMKMTLNNATILQQQQAVHNNGNGSASGSQAAHSFKRRSMIQWVVSCATELGIDALRRIMHHWYHFFTPTEATQHVAVPIMNHQTVMRLGLNFSQQEELSNVARQLALDCMNKDPPNCALTALGLCENEQFAFEQAYRLVSIAGSSGIMSPQQLFQIARYMEVRGLPDHAYKVALLAVKLVQVSPNGDNHAHIQDIHWACSMAFSLGKGEMAELIPILVRNIQCAPVLSDILRRCTLANGGHQPVRVPVLPPDSLVTPLTSVTGTVLPPPTSLSHHHHSHHGFHESSSSSKRSSSSRNNKILPIDKPPLRLLLDAAIAAYVNTTHSRLTHISPRHYGDFIEFLTKAQDTFKMSPDGAMQFASLLENMKMVYKGKKKLMFLVKERFG